jgi:cation diffusion facilitator family transporter
MARSATSTTVWAAVIGNALVAITKVAAALWSGSSAMLSEAVHSVVHTGNEGLLLYGMRRSRQRPDAEHPFGFGRELYFWSFIVALFLFGLGCVASVLQGIDHIRHPHPVEHPGVIYTVLALSVLFEGSTWVIALKGFKPSVGAAGIWTLSNRARIRRSLSSFSKIPPPLSALPSRSSVRGPRSVGTSPE